MILGADAGYGYVKAIAENGDSVIFPSVVGSGCERKIEKMLQGGQSDSDNYDLVINGLDRETQHYFVGNLAILQSPDAARPFSDDRSKAEEIKPALLTAIARLSKGEKITLVTGLPLEPFFLQAPSLKNSLEKMSGVQVALNGEESTIEIEQVIMLPQAVAAMYGVLKRNNVGSTGVVGLSTWGLGPQTLLCLKFRGRKPNSLNVWRCGTDKRFSR